MPIPKALYNFVREKTPTTYGNQSFYYINKEERGSRREHGMYMTFITFLFRSNAIFLKRVQTLTVQYKGAFKPNLPPGSCSLRSTCFGRQLKACQEKVVDLCLKSSRQLYTARAYCKHTMLTRCSISSLDTSQGVAVNPRRDVRYEGFRHTKSELHKNPLENLFTAQRSAEGSSTKTKLSPSADWRSHPYL